MNTLILGFMCLGADIQGGGTCVVKPPPLEKIEVVEEDPRGYAACKKAVLAGDDVMLCVGSHKNQECIYANYFCESIPGMQDGRYKCYLVKGVPMMKLDSPYKVNTTVIQAAPRITPQNIPPQFQQWFPRFGSGCGPGGCPTPIIR